MYRWVMESAVSRRIAALLPFLLVLSLAPVEVAAKYPERPIRLVVAYASGGNTDVLARILAQGLSKNLGQAVVVENRAGAGGVIGTQAVATAQPDGYTLLLAGDSSLTVLPQLTSPQPYDGQKDFTPLRMVAAQVNVLVAHVSKEFRDVGAVIARARKAPGSLTFGSAGSGSPAHLIGALFQAESGVELTHVPYKGAGQAMADLLGGRIDLMFVGMPVALQNRERKEVVLLAVTGDQRAKALPGTPTFAEAGVAGLGGEVAVWWALVAPAGLPRDVASLLDKAAQASLADAKILESFSLQGVDVLNRDGATTSAWISRDSQRWSALIKAKKIGGN